jgi:hypothetical protein
VSPPSPPSAIWRPGTATAAGVSGQGSADRGLVCRGIESSGAARAGAAREVVRELRGWRSWRSSRVAVPPRPCVDMQCWSLHFPYRVGSSVAALGWRTVLLYYRRYTCCDLFILIINSTIYIYRNK